MDATSKPRRARGWLLSLCVLSAFTVLSVTALAMPRPASTESLSRAYFDLAKQRGVHRGDGLVITERHDRAFVGHHSDDHVSRLKRLFVKMSTVCLVSRSQMELIEQVFDVEFKTIRIHGIEKKVMVIRNVRNPHLVPKLERLLGDLDCMRIPTHFSWVVFVFNPHLS